MSAEPIESLHSVADSLDRAGVRPVKVQVTQHHDRCLVDILCATRTDLFALCDHIGIKHPKPSERARESAADGQLHYSTIARNGWLLRAVSFPHHADRALPDQEQP